MVTEDEKCGTCDGTGAAAVEVDGVKGIDSCPACDGTGKAKPAANDGKKLAPLVAEGPTMSLSAAVAACVASAYGRVVPRNVDPDEVTVVARFDLRSVAR